MSAKPDEFAIIAAAVSADLRRIAQSGVTVAVEMEFSIRDGHIRPHYYLGERRSRRLLHSPDGRSSIG